MEIGPEALKSDLGLRYQILGLGNFNFDFGISRDGFGISIVTLILSIVTLILFIVTLIFRMRLWYSIERDFDMSLVALIFEKRLGYAKFDGLGI